MYLFTYLSLLKYFQKSKLFSGTLHMVFVVLFVCMRKYATHNDFSNDTSSWSPRTTKLYGKQKHIEIDKKKFNAHNLQTATF